MRCNERDQKERDLSQQYKGSYYNHAFPYRDHVLLFNGVSSALSMVDQKQFQTIEPYLFRQHSYSLDSIQDSETRRLLEQYLASQYVVPEDLDEVNYLRDRFRMYQENDPLSVTVTTTMDCNLGCYYCFEDKYKDYLSREVCDKIYHRIVTDLEARPQKKIYFAWYGGEPMLNREAIEYLSAKMIAYCDAHDISYRASMISNGSVWPDDPVECTAFVERVRLKHVQFSFDGLAVNHSKRRRYIDGNHNHAVSSFDRLCATVDALRGHLKVYLRLNIDKGNQGDAYHLVDFFHAKGWLYPGSLIYPYLAHLGPLTEACQSTLKSALEVSDFDEANNRFRRYLSQYVDLREFAFSYYPRSLPVNCAAVNSHSYLFGPDGAMYKCAHEVGIHSFSHDHVDAPKEPKHSEFFPILKSDSVPSAPHDYLAYDPFSHEMCSKCKYLPNCLGGCPKAQFEKKEYYIDAFHQFWENSLGPMLTTFADAMLSGGLPLTREVIETPLSAEAISTQKELKGLTS